MAILIIGFFFFSVPDFDHLCGEFRFLVNLDRFRERGKSDVSSLGCLPFRMKTLAFLFLGFGLGFD